MAGNSSKIYIEVEVDGKGGIKVLRQIGTESEKTGKKGKKSFQDMGRSVGGFNARMQSAHGMLLKLGIGIGAIALARQLKGVVDVASDLQEVTSKFEVVFAGQIPRAEAWSKVLVDAYAMSTRESKQYLSSVQDLLVPMGMQAQSAAALSFEIVKLSADLGSFNNLPTAQVMDDIQSALVGNYETMKKYGVVLNATTVQETALAMGLAKTKDQLTAGQKAQAAYQMMVRGSQAAVGDMDRTSAGYANQTKKLTANIEELQVLLGNQFLPTATKIVANINQWIEANDSLIKQKVPEYIDTVKTAASGLHSTLSGLYGLYEKIPGEVVGAAGYGIAGRIIFGGWGPAKVAGGIYLINEGLKQFNADIGTAVKNWKDWETAVNNIMDVISGKRDWNTGAQKSQRIPVPETAPVYTGEIGPSTPGYDIYKPGPAAAPPPAPGDNKAALAEYKALMKEVEKAQQEFQDALVMPEGTGALVDEQLRRDVGKYAAGYDSTLADIERSKEAYAEMYADLKFQSADYFEYRASLLAEQAVRYAEATGDEVMAHAWLCDQLKILDAERVAAAEETNSILQNLSERTSDAIEDTFSDLVYDLKDGWKDWHDYANKLSNSLWRITSDILGQMLKDWLLGAVKTGTAMALEGAQVTALTSLYYALAVAKAAAGALGGGGAGAGAGAGAGSSYGGVDIGAPFAKGGTFGRNKYIMVGEEGPELLYTGNNYGGVIPNDQTVNIVNHQAAAALAEAPPAPAPAGGDLTISIPVAIDTGNERLASRLAHEVEETARRVVREEMR